ncbi:hypothetical protein OQA88_9812 [Cercophora sp. LCS_1]
MDITPTKRRKLGHSGEPESALQSVASTGLSRSRAFVLEAEELLNEVGLDYATVFEGADRLLRKIKSSIETIEPHESLQITEAALRLERKHGIRIPFPEPRPRKESNHKVAFTKPNQFNVVGSYVSKSMIKTQKDHAIDMVFVIPAEALQEKDYLDLRYFHKRAYYLGVVSAALKRDFGDAADLSYEYLNGNPLCPVISVRPKSPESLEGPSGFNSTDSVHYRVRIIPSSPEGFFPKSKLQLDAGLLRKGWDGLAATSLPTPFYNSSLAAEACFFPYLKLMRMIEKTCAAFKSACILGRIWLQQRGFGSNIANGGFGHFEWALLLALLIQGGGNKGTSTLSPSLSSTQLFKATVQFLAVSNLAEKPYTFGSADIDTAGPVIYDSTRQLNIAFKMSPWSAVLLHHHARWTRNLMNDSAVDQFVPSLILKADMPVHNFDLVARLNHFGTFDVAGGADSRGKAWEFSSKLYEVLKRALSDKELGERARLIHLGTPALPAWSLTEDCVTPDECALEIGILFDPINVARMVDRGPIAGPTAQEREECERFRGFWGPKAELRRFEGDAIRETVIWSSTSPLELCEEIMRYTLNRHLGVGALEDDMLFYGSGLSAVLPVKSTDTAVFNNARKAFGTFERDIRELDELPLHVRQIAPICSELRHTSVKLPVLGSSKARVVPMETVVSFEASGKWPENLAAIQRTKVAFLLMISSLLEKTKAGQVRTFIGLEDTKSEVENLAFLDVIYETGAAFRLRIHSDLEETLLERQAKDKTQEQHVRATARALLGTFRRLYTHLPLHSQTVTTFVTRFPALSSTTRLLKHWFWAHKLSNHFTDEFIELVTLHIFLAPYPWDAPSSANTGFFRALLFLAHWNWRSEPLVIDTGGEMPPTDRKAIATRLEAWRKIDPAMNHTVLFMATTQDNTGIAYTSSHGQAKPAKVAAARMTALAKSACCVVREQGVKLDTKGLFVPSCKDYDVVIRLNGRAIRASSRTYVTDNPDETRLDSRMAHPRFKNLDERTGQDPLPVAQHSTETLLGQIDVIFSGTLVFFRGSPDDLTIGAIWNPQARRKQFKVNLPASYEPGKSGAKEALGDEEDAKVDVLLNQEAIIAEIARIGGDLIEKIDVKGLDR